MLQYIMGCFDVIQIYGIYQHTYHQYINSQNGMKEHFTRRPALMIIKPYKTNNFPPTTLVNIPAFCS